MGNRLVLRRNSIFWKILLIMLGAMLIQFALLSGVLFLGGITNQLKENAFNILDGQVGSRKDNLEDDMLQRWGNLNESVQAINDDISQCLAESGMEYSDLNANTELSAKALRCISEDLIYYLRRNSVTGAFVVLNGNQPSHYPILNEKQERAALYIRDNDPLSNPNDYSDLMIERAPSALIKELGISMDSYWNPQFSFESGDSCDFFYKPFCAAMEHPGTDFTDLGYWAPYFTLKNDVTKIITYSLPLIADDDTPYGVIGIELTSDYLVKQLPYSEINNDKQGSYILAVGHGNTDTFQHIISSGPYYKRVFGEETSISCSSAVRDDVFLMNHNDRLDDNVYGCVKKINLYNSNTPFEEDQWVLVGVVESKDLLHLYHTVVINLLLCLIVAFLIGVCGVCIVGRKFTMPIARLAQKVRESNPSKPVELGKINIAEIDELSRSIEYMSYNIAQSSSRLSQFMGMSDYSMGAFEYDCETKKISSTDGFFNLIGMQDLKPSGNDMGVEEFQHIMEEFERRYLLETESQSNRIYKIERDREPCRWLRLKMISDKTHILGMVTDITKEYKQKKKSEYERDYDSLTGLLNRHAFRDSMSELLSNKAEVQFGAFVMLDLDNLKYINDTYGHDAGDEYLRKTADVIKMFTAYQGIASRISSDEFNLFFWGRTQKELQNKIEDMEERFKQADIRLPDGKWTRIRLSGGVAWYPADTDDLNRMMQYADFAMYHVKHTTKGKFEYFDAGLYKQESYLIHNREELNRIIDEERVEYEFQPIISASDGSVYAYEALMRPISDSIKSPVEILSMARAQSKLYQIERLTWFKALETFSHISRPGERVKLFINSIPNQMLADNDLTIFEERFAPYLSRLVVELTEEEKANEDFNMRKSYYVNRWGGAFALDDYGSGYNGEVVLLSLSPRYIKIDRMIIQRIHEDDSRLQLFRNIVSYAHEHDMYVVAEGIETEKEIETLVTNGADFLQGYYIGCPAKALYPVDSKIIAKIQKLHKKE